MLKIFKKTPKNSGSMIFRNFKSGSLNLVHYRKSVNIRTSLSQLKKFQAIATAETIL